MAFRWPDSQRIHNYSSHSTFCADRSRPKFVIFVRDVPAFGRRPLSLQILNELSKYDLMPVYHYSALELMKDRRNLKKMRSFTIKTPQHKNKCNTSDAILIAKGCNGIMKHLFQRALRSNPELVLLDYLSETFVDAEKMVEMAKGLDYTTFFVKKQLDIKDEETIVRNIANIISSNIKFQNRAEIRLQRQADKYFHELGKIFIPTEKDHSLSYYDCPYLIKGKMTHFDSNDCKRNPSTDFLIEFKEQTERYYSALENLAISMDDPKFGPNIHPSKRESTDKNAFNGSEYTLLIIDDYYCRRPTKPRLFEIFMEKFVKENFPAYHVIPIGELVISPKFQNLFKWFCLRSDMNLSDTYSFLFIDAFNMLHKTEQEKIVILDNIHDGIVMSSYYIRRALEQQWEVFIVKRDNCWTWTSQADVGIVDSVFSILHQKYSPTNIQTDRGSNSKNNAFGDYFLY